MLMQTLGQKKSIMVFSEVAFSRFSCDVTAAMLVHRTITKKIETFFGTLILLLCKTWATFCHCFTHQHGRLITSVKTKNKTAWKKRVDLLRLRMLCRPLTTFTIVRTRLKETNATVCVCIYDEIIRPISQSLVTCTPPNNADSSNWPF